MKLIRKFFFSRREGGSKNADRYLTPALVEKLLIQSEQGARKELLGEPFTCMVVASNSSREGLLFDEVVAKEIAQKIGDVEFDGWHMQTISPVPTLELVELSEDNAALNIRRVKSLIDVMARRNIRIVVATGMVKWKLVGARVGHFGDVVNAVVVGAVKLPRDRSWIDESLAHMLGIAVSAPLHEVAGSKFMPLNAV